MIYQLIADIIGELSVSVIAIFFLYYLCKELGQVRQFRRQGILSTSDGQYFTLRRCIRTLCLIWALLEIPFFGVNIWNDTLEADFHETLDAWAYAGHLFSQAAIYGAFCGFTVLWLVILKFTQRAVRCAAFVTVCFSVAYFVFTIFLSQQVISSSEPLLSQPLYQYDFVVIPVTLMSISFLFLGYGAYLQFVLKSWYKNNIGWQRHVLIKLNMIVGTITLACVLRTTMVVLLRIELSTRAWEFFTTTRDDGDTHPIIWTLTAQVIPFSTLAIVLFYMSRPSPHSDTTVALSTSSQIQGTEPLYVQPNLEEQMDYYVAQSPSYSHSYFLSNNPGDGSIVQDDSGDETHRFQGGRSFKDLEARPHSLPNSLDLRPPVTAITHFGSFLTIKRSNDNVGKSVETDKVPD